MPRPSSRVIPAVRVTRAPHGTYTRYQQERLALQVPCDACLAANRAQAHSYRMRRSRKCTPGLGWPLADPGLDMILRGHHA